MAKTTVTPAQVQHIGRLATIPLSETELQNFSHAFEETLVVVDELREPDVSQVEPTSQVTGFINVWREDIAKPDHTFSQTAALKNAAKTHAGYFMVPGVLTAKDA
jgi:aspartyl-tRNA(Asn)/glutamyl-tRNA(Gln) amidotransferase subunit C